MPENIISSNEENLTNIQISTEFLIQNYSKALISENEILARASRNLSVTSSICIRTRQDLLNSSTNLTGGIPQFQLLFLRQVESMHYYSLLLLQFVNLKVESMRYSYYHRSYFNYFFSRQVKRMRYYHYYRFYRYVRD